jgi:hypothetical protein
MDNVLRSRIEWAHRGLIPKLGERPVGVRRVRKGERGRVQLFSINQLIPRVINAPILPPEREAARQAVIQKILTDRNIKKQKRLERKAKKEAKQKALAPVKPKGLLSIIFGF